MVIVTDPRKITIVGRSVHRDIFAKHISLSDAYTWITAFELQIAAMQSINVCGIEHGKHQLSR